MTRRIIISIIGLNLLCAASYAAISIIEQTMKPVSESLDELLIKTQQVFVQRDDNVDAFYVDGVGCFWIGRISIAGSESLSISIQDWSKWFDNPSKKLKENPQEDENQDLAKLKRLLEMDKERLNQMEKRLSIFKQEMRQFIARECIHLDTIPANESLFFIFKVADEEFEKKYGTSTFKLQVSQKDLAAHAGAAEHEIPESVILFNL